MSRNPHVKPAVSCRKTVVALQQKVRGEDSVLEFAIKLAQNGTHQRTRAVAYEMTDQILVVHDLLLSGELMDAMIGDAEVHHLGLVLHLGGVTGDVMHNLANINSRPVVQVLEVLHERGLEPGLDDGHVKVVGENEGLDQLGDHGGGLADAGSRAASQKGEVETLEVFNANLR